MLEPLPDNPELWTFEQMWGLVNAIDVARQSGAIADGMEVTVVATARPILLVYAREAMVKHHGWSWSHHHYDETIEVHFNQNAVIIRCGLAVDKILLSRMMSYFAILSLMAGNSSIIDGQIECSIGDADGDRDTVCFSSKRAEALLVPDPYYMLTRAYESEKTYFNDCWIDFEDRLAKGYWRGAASGLGKYARQEDSQRVRLVIYANQPDTFENFNVKFASEAGLESDLASKVSDLGGFSLPEDQMEILKYRYNFDIDGVSSSWTGLFLKMLSGSTVIKILSDQDYTQWYYPEMKPWVHYAPVAPDLSDLATVCQLLAARPDFAATIARNGRDFALSLDLASQLHHGARTMERAFFPVAPALQPRSFKYGKI